jgi:hypothetical protein
MGLKSGSRESPESPKDEKKGQERPKGMEEKKAGEKIVFDHTKIKTSWR